MGQMLTQLFIRVWVESGQYVNIQKQLTMNRMRYKIYRKV